ncbi:putative protease Do-like 14 [Rhododendron vialii]|uniref:putative protease Do-like 14 n=1 Tax=Rhododendron vialii TaxID=182163 RepID=UPI00265E5AE7|nr:putative protease Do-like 14 [Rhododendron vialii]
MHKDAILDEGVGTGFLLDRDGYILTCAHVLSILQEFKVGDKNVERWLPGQVRTNFRGEDAYVVDVKSIDIGNDVALLKLPPGVIKQSHLPCVLTKVPPDMGEYIFLVGHPASLPFPLRFGHVINPRRSLYDFSPGHLARFPQHDEYMDPDMKFLELDMRSAPGFSGGPLATMEGAKAAYGILSSMITKVLEKMHKRSLADNSGFIEPEKPEADLISSLRNFMLGSIYSSC